MKKMEQIHKEACDKETENAQLKTHREQQCHEIAHLRTVLVALHEATEVTTEFYEQCGQLHMRPDDRTASRQLLALQLGLSDEVSSKRKRSKIEEWVGSEQEGSVVTSSDSIDTGVLPLAQHCRDDEEINDAINLDLFEVEFLDGQTDSCFGSGSGSGCGPGGDNEESADFESGKLSKGQTADLRACDSGTQASMDLLCVLEAVASLFGLPIQSDTEQPKIADREQIAAVTRLLIIGFCTAAFVYQLWLSQTNGLCTVYAPQHGAMVFYLLLRKPCHAELVRVYLLISALFCPLTFFLAKIHWIPCGSPWPILLGLPLAGALLNVSLKQHLLGVLCQTGAMLIGGTTDGMLRRTGVMIISGPTVVTALVSVCAHVTWGREMAANDGSLQHVIKV